MRPLPSTLLLNVFECVLLTIPESAARKFGFRNARPHGAIVILALIFLFAFLITSVFAIAFPNPATKLAITIFDSALAAVLLGLYICDVISSEEGVRATLWYLHYPERKRRYRRNLANTVITVLLTIVTMMALYRSRWYDALNRDAIELLSRNVVNLPILIKFRT